MLRFAMGAEELNNNEVREEEKKKEVKEKAEPRSLDDLTGGAQREKLGQAEGKTQELKDMRKSTDATKLAMRENAAEDEAYNQQLEKSDARANDVQDLMPGGVFMKDQHTEATERGKLVAAKSKMEKKEDPETAQQKNKQVV